MKDYIKIYIASPYTHGWQTTNVKRQMDMADDLMNLGYFPYAPLLCHFQQLVHPRLEHDWLNLDLVFLKICDAVLRIKPIVDGVEIPSSGADLEERTAIEIGIPVFYKLEDLHAYFRKNAKKKDIKKIKKISKVASKISKMH